MLLAGVIAGVGCHGQTAPVAAANADALTPDMVRRVEVLLRSRSNVPPEYVIQVGPRTRTDVPGFSAISITFVADGKASKPMTFLLSEDGKTLAQLNKYDISKDPKELVSGSQRPGRGGTEAAPVLIVGFDDLECPFCARMHQQLFPALLERYKSQVRVVYRDYPLSQHPWAMRAAIDTNCVGAQSAPGYWNLVDYIHAHADELGGTEKSLEKANQRLDALAEDEGKKQGVEAAGLKACLEKQDDSGVKASMKIAESLGVEATPALFINGEKVEGAIPLEYVFRMIDGALVAAGQTPPPAFVPAAKPASAAKPGN